MADETQTWVQAMRDGRFADAWAISECTLAACDPATRDDPALPYHLRWVWDGRRFDGCDVLVRCYRGLGDTIQFARYLPLLAARAASVTVEAPARLHGLLATVPGGHRLVAFDPAKPLPPAACDIEIMELAFALREPPAAVPPPYLSADPAPLPPGTIGLCHAGGDWDPARSFPAGRFARIAADHPCVTLVAEPSPLPVLNPEGCPFDVPATAALVAGVDLVITVDTMIAHLAGAMGRPTWLLLRADPDWRWTPGAAGSAWYPSMRLFTQPQPGDWSSVIASVERELAALVPSAAKGNPHGPLRQSLGPGLLG